MDRTMYGKIDPGARQPYRTVRSKGIQPGCKYYAWKINILKFTVIITWLKRFICYVNDRKGNHIDIVHVM